MKHTLTFFLFFAVILLPECQKDDDLEVMFGDAQSGFQLDSVYLTETSGLLYVQIKTTAGTSYFRILADQNPEPTTEIAKIPHEISATLPLQKGTYWKVEKHLDFTITYKPIKDTLITWTPMMLTTVANNK